MKSNRLVLMGKILGPHGRAGALKVLSYAESPERFKTGEPIHLKPAQGEAIEKIVRWVKPHHRHLLISIEGINDRDAAKGLKGLDLFIRRDRLPKLEEGTYYWYDLLGLRVSTSQGQFIGVIERIIDTGANDVYVVKDGDKETMVPAIATVIRQVDLKNRCMRIRLPD